MPLLRDVILLIKRVSFAASAEGGLSFVVNVAVQTWSSLLGAGTLSSVELRKALSAGSFHTLLLLQDLD